MITKPKRNDNVLPRACGSLVWLRELSSRRICSLHHSSNHPKSHRLVLNIFCVYSVVQYQHRTSCFFVEKQRDVRIIWFVVCKKHARWCFFFAGSVVSVECSGDVLECQQVIHSICLVFTDFHGSQEISLKW